MNISICKFHDRSILKIGDESVFIKDYKISSSKHGGTELEIVIEADSVITEFAMSARRKSLTRVHSGICGRCTGNDRPDAARRPAVSGTVQRMKRPSGRTADKKEGELSFV